MSTGCSRRVDAHSWHHTPSTASAAVHRAHWALSGILPSRATTAVLTLVCDVMTLESAAAVSRLEEIFAEDVRLSFPQGGPDAAVEGLAALKESLTKTTSTSSTTRFLSAYLDGDATWLRATESTKAERAFMRKTKETTETLVVRLVGQPIARIDYYQEPS